MFRSYGQNAKNELGLEDDLDVYYIAGAKVSQKALITHLKNGKDSDYWSIYENLFPKNKK